MRILAKLAALVILMTLLITCHNRPVQETGGPLKISKENPRYFTDGSGKAVYLTGAHTWNNLVDMGPDDPPEAFDFERYIQWLKDYNHNFIRLWAWELTNWDTRGNRNTDPRIHFVAPHPWMRTGPGLALDGKPRFDLQELNPLYMDRLRERLEIAQRNGIYVAVMLFEGWGLQFAPGGWEHHPFHPGNNINGINGDADGDGRGLEIHQLVQRKITEIQEEYVRQVIDLVNDLDNVLFEISNENHPASTDWQYHMINFIKDHESTLPKQHPVGMTFQYRGGSNSTLFEGPADWISPNPEGGYKEDPPPADGSKVIITDTDHLGGIWGNQPWVWKSFLRGHNPIFMDCYDMKILKRTPDMEWAEPIRKSMGYTLQFANRVDLLNMVPDTLIASSGYCLANHEREYLVYKVENEELILNLEQVSGDYTLEWFDPNTGLSRIVEDISGGELVSPPSPFGSVDAIAYLKRK